MATSDDEHAVSSTTAGPCTPRKYDSRPAAKFDALPNGRYGSKSFGRTPPSVDSQEESAVVRPTEIPVWVLRIALGVTPTCSSASQETSSSSRCWGSIATASRGDIPKNSASNSSGRHEVRNPPSRLQIVPGRVWSSEKYASASQRSSGTRITPLTPSCSSCQ